VAKALRQQVFQQELGLPEEAAWDAMDPYAYHLVLKLGEVPVATGRILYGGPGTAKLSHICVLQKYRRQGIGDGLVKILDYKSSQLGMAHSTLESTPELTDFYRRIGYRPEGEPTERWGRTLITMTKETNDGTRENCAHQCAGKKGQD
jgi:predicted GNAT family N-acyltransferase